ncbi:MAG: hypothetical protein ABJC13_12230 [Acidobacteriota bacterium]
MTTRTQEGAAAAAKAEDVERDIAARREIDAEEYEQLRRGSQRPGRDVVT